MWLTGSSAHEPTVAHFCIGANKQYPRFAHGDKLDPFTDADHRSHMNSHVSTHFPQMMQKAAWRQESIVFRTGNDAEDTFIIAAFVDPNGLQFS